MVAERSISRWMDGGLEVGAWRDGQSRALDTHGRGRDTFLRSRGRGNISIGAAAAKQMHWNEKGAEDEENEREERREHHNEWT